jgi:hypothetical protein
VTAFLRPLGRPPFLPFSREARASGIGRFQNLRT